jgi:anti-sigma regulatory factor (Ser/Thr protein kinase)
MEEKFERDFKSLDGIFEFIGRFLTDNKIDESLSFSINLAVEELFINMVRHNTGGGRAISIRMKTEDGRLIVTLVDEDVDPFDPSRIPDVELDQPIEERKAGGLGLHLVKSIVDKITYEYKDRRMQVTIMKELGR